MQAGREGEGSSKEREHWKGEGCNHEGAEDVDSLYSNPPGPGARDEDKDEAEINTIKAQRKRDHTKQWEHHRVSRVADIPSVCRE